MAKAADFIQENIPEQLALKQRMLADISRHAGADVIIASSTSGLTPTDLQRDMVAPERFLVAHPFNPVYLLPLVELVPGAKTAAFHEPYVADPVRGCCFRGGTMLTVPELIRWLGKCEKLALAAKIHCAGDAAVTQALDAIDVVRSFNGPTHLIHHIAHASYITPDDIPRFAELGVAADLSPIIWYPTIFLEAHKAAMGEERALRFWPNKDLNNAGALMAGGSDWPVIPNPDKILCIGLNAFALAMTGSVVSSRRASSSTPDPAPKYPL